jgi:hypothetical protein
VESFRTSALAGQGAFIGRSRSRVMVPRRLAMVLGLDPAEAMGVVTNFRNATSCWTVTFTRRAQRFSMKPRHFPARASISTK